MNSMDEEKLESFCNEIAGTTQDMMAAFEGRFERLPTEEEAKYLDMVIFTCSCCGWTLPTDEIADSDEDLICIQCADEMYE